MDIEIAIRCARCDRGNRIPRPADAPIEGGAELDGRPLTATPAVVRSWRWTCAGCGLVTPSVEAALAALAAGDADVAIEMALRAAWIADDHSPDDACECRETAAWLLRRFGGSQALQADLRRRNGDFESAIAAARRGLATAIGPELFTLAMHQLRLAQAGDTERHSMVALFSREHEEIV